MWIERLGFQLGMKLNSDEPGMRGNLHDLGKYAVRRKSGEDHSVLLQLVTVFDIDLIAVPMALRDEIGAVDLRHPAARSQNGIVGAKAHGAAKINLCVTALDGIAPH